MTLPFCSLWRRLWWVSSVPEPGGEPYDREKFEEGVLRAELCNLANSYDYKHGSRMVDELLRRFDVTRKPKEKAA